MGEQDALGIIARWAFMGFGGGNWQAALRGTRCGRWTFVAWHGFKSFLSRVRRWIILGLAAFWVHFVQQRMGIRQVERW